MKFVLDQRSIGVLSARFHRETAVEPLIEAHGFLLSEVQFLGKSKISNRHNCSSDDRRSLEPKLNMFYTLQRTRRNTLQDDLR